ncbi:MAG: diguanylate cyclase [Eubacteriales bacterium]|nr:diguanylate cyclase [Eubacteriales bacterium]
METTKWNKHSINRVFIAVFCGLIGICVAIVMFRVYEPNQNALGALASVCMDVICMIILVILIGSFAFGNYGSNRTTKWFAGLLLASIWAMFLDFLNWAFDGSLELGHLTYYFTVGSLCMGPILACIFSMYLYSYMEETHSLEKMRKSAIVCAIMNMISFGLSLTLAVTGTAFRFVDGHYETGALYDACTVIPILTLLYMTGFAICHVKKIGAHDVFAVAGYIFFMVAGALVESAYNIGTTYVAVAIADIFIFVMLQNEIIAQEKRNVQEWMKKSNTDELTGFYNRHAYEADLKTLESGTVADNFVYVSMDVNSLKMVNDSLGHNAGDELLVGAAECLKKSFGSYGKLYRIGGDEFIALIFADEEQLQTIQKNAEEIIGKWSGNLVQSLTISSGFVTRNEAKKMTVRQMAIIADQRMYEAKDEYYRSTGIERRRE